VYLVCHIAVLVAGVSALCYMGVRMRRVFFRQFGYGRRNECLAQSFFFFFKKRKDLEGSEAALKGGLTL
jgi:hypothetical protein